MMKLEHVFIYSVMFLAVSASARAIAVSAVIGA